MNSEPLKLPLHIEGKKLNRKIVMAAVVILMLLIVLQYIALGNLPGFLWFVAIALLIVAIYTFLQPSFSGPAIMLNDEGILDQRMGVGTIRWLDIKRAYQYRLNHADFICFELRDERKYLARRSLLARLNSVIYPLVGLKPISIVASGLSIDPALLFNFILEEVERRRAEDAQLSMGARS